VARSRLGVIAVCLALLAVACGGGTQAAVELRGPRQATVVEPFTPETVAPAEEATAEWSGDPLAPGLGNGGYDVARYQLDFELLPDEVPQVMGKAVLTSTALADLDQFSLDFEGSTVTQVIVNHTKAEYSREGAELSVVPTEKILDGEEFVVAVDFATYLPAASGRSELAIGEVGWIQRSDGGWYTQSDPDGAHYWFPANDHPSDRAEFVTSITVPAGMIAVASGVEGTQAHNPETSTYRWVVANEIPTHAMTMVIAGPGLSLVEDEQGSEATGIQLRHLLPPKMAKKLPDVLRRVDNMILFLEQRLGRFPYDAWGVAVVGDNAPSRPANGWTIMTADELESKGASLRLMADLTSQYFGQAAGIESWSDVWITSSIPTYMAWLWLQGSVGPTGLEVTIAAARARVNNSAWPPPDAPRPGDVYVGSVSVRGALFLHALSLRLGDSRFFDLLARLYNDYRGDTVSTEEFMDLMNEIAGERLDSFADAWFHRNPLPGFPDG